MLVSLCTVVETISSESRSVSFLVISILLLLLFSWRTTLLGDGQLASITEDTEAVGLLPFAPEKRLLASENAMHPSRVHVLMECWLGEFFICPICFSERRSARCKEPMALSYWPTSMQRAALLFSFWAKALRAFPGGDRDGDD